MIAGIFHEGSGLGDQLFRYITVRTLAEEKGYKWEMMNHRFFKGHEFLKIPYESGSREPGYQMWLEKDIRDANGVDVRSYDPEINFVQDKTFIDGSFEDDKYWRHNLSNIKDWLQTDAIGVPDDFCVIGFRGGEYASDPMLFLTKEYWEDAIGKMRQINSQMRFQVHTDDPKLAAQFFPEFEVVDNVALSHSKHSNMALNWRTMRFARYAIIANSAFFIMPRILKHSHDAATVTIAPRYWARRNTKTWARPACFYKEFQYI